MQFLKVSARPSPSPQKGLKGVGTLLFRYFLRGKVARLRKAFGQKPAFSSSRRVGLLGVCVCCNLNPDCMFYGQAEFVKCDPAWHAQRG